MSHDKLLEKEGHVYCPICGRVIAATNLEDAEGAGFEGFIFVHDGIPHSDSDMRALEMGIQ